MNLFEHQQFLLRRSPTPEHPLGERIRRSYRELMIGPDEDLQFDYPLEYLNVAALALCAAVTQAFFEPVDSSDLAERVRRPLTADEFEHAIGPERERFSIDGDVRFLQGPAPEPSRKAEPLADRLFPIAGSFLNRPDQRWVVALDQIPLLLFSRSTFYEKSAGRGYLTGTSGDLEIRTYPIDRGLLDGPSLRRTIWLNVLARTTQAEYEGLYHPAGTDGGYDDWMWIDPPKSDLVQGSVSLRSGLFWMVATGYIDIAEIERSAPCIVTGELVTGRAGVGVFVRTSGVGYGVTVEREKGPAVRQSFFLNPNGPYRVVDDKKTGARYLRHLSVDDVSGLFGQMGGLFFSSTSHAQAGHKTAPVVGQLPAIRERFGDDLRIDLHCFGFHMLSSKQNIHGGCESERFQYPVLDRAGDDVDHAHGLMVGAAQTAEDIRRLLCRAIQICMMIQVDTKSDDGRLKLQPKTNIDTGGFTTDIGREFWSRAGRDVQELLRRIEQAATRGAASGRAWLVDAVSDIENWWRRAAAGHARAVFEPVFNDYCATPQHLVAAHNARKIFYGSLRKMGVSFGSSAETDRTSTSTEVIA